MKQQELWFYSKNEATNFNADIANDHNFKSFKYQVKLLENTVADGANGIFKNATIAVPLNYLTNVWRSLKVPFINWKAELKLKWRKYCVLTAAADDNTNNIDYSNIIFTIKDTKLYVPVITITARDNQKLLKLLSKGFEISVYWNKCKTKSENKNTTNEYRPFLKLNFVGVYRLFALAYPNPNNNVKRFKAQKYYLRKAIIKYYHDIINGKDF